MLQNRTRGLISAFFALMLLAGPVNFSSAQESKEAEAKSETPTEAAGQGKPKWNRLIPKKGLGKWEISDFGTQGEVERVGDTIVLGRGDPLTGITWKAKEYPKDNYEIEVKAKRVEGNDFLCGLTFPVGDEFCTMIAGGWGGSLVGLSNVNGFDASENATTTTGTFDDDVWYTFRVTVDQEMIRGWVDDKEYFRLEREGIEFSTRIEVFVSQPLGYAVYQSKVILKDFRWRKLPE